MPSSALAGWLPPLWQDALLTYLIHSTILLGGAWLASRARSNMAPRWREALWGAAFVGGLFTTAAQMATGVEPLGGQMVWSYVAGSPGTGSSIDRYRLLYLL